MTTRDTEIFWDKYVCKSCYLDLTESQWEPGQAVVDQRDRKYFADLFVLLECFLDELVSDKTLPFVPRVSTDRGGAYDRTQLAERYFTKVPEFLTVAERLPLQNRYSEHLEAFIACCKEMGLFGQTLPWSDIWEAPCLTYSQFGGASAADLFNLLVAKLRDRCLSEQTKARARRRRSDAANFASEYASYVDALFGISTRLVVLRIDLEYLKQHKDQIGILDALADLDRFLTNQRHNSIFREKLGYIVKLEYGVLKGLHFHLILFFDGSKRDGRKDVHLAQEIGEYWKKVITKGRGDYWNINAKKAKYERNGSLGIGVINSWETKLVENLKHRVVGYLCKSTQYVKPRLPEELDKYSNRLIRRGKFPKVPQKKRGRPPKKAPELP